MHAPAVITSIYISNLKSYVNAYYIEDVFNRKCIAKVSRVAIQTCYTEEGAYKRAWIDISEWHDTENAYKFVKSLQNYGAANIKFRTQVWNVEVNTNPEEALNAEIFYLFRPFHTMHTFYEEQLECPIPMPPEYEAVPVIESGVFYPSLEEIRTQHLPRHIV